MKNDSIWMPPQRQSLIDRTVQSLLQGIDSGVWQNELPSERNLCGVLGVSRPTLRAALEELENSGVLQNSRGRRRRITAHASDRARSSRHRTVGLLTPVPLEAVPPFVLNWIDLLRTRLARERVMLEIHCAPRCYGKVPSGALAAQLARTPAGFWILFRSTLMMQQWFQQRRVPCVLAGSPLNEIALPSIDIDYRAACRHAGSVLRKRGHENVCLLLPEGRTGGDMESIAGLSERFSEPELKVLFHDSSREGIVARVDEALSQRKAIRAFMVGRSAPVLTVITRLLQRGLMIPNDVSVISRDDDAHLEFLTPRVTRYTAPSAAFGKYVSKLCLRAIAGARLPPRALKILPCFIKGETV